MPTIRKVDEDFTLSIKYKPIANDRFKRSIFRGDCPDPSSVTILLKSHAINDMNDLIDNYDYQIVNL